MTDGHLETTSVMHLGAVSNYRVGLQLCNATRFHEALTELLTQCAKPSIPNLTFSSIQVGRTVPPKLHVVPRNVGISGLVAFGDYVDGRFWTGHDARGDVAMEVSEPIRNRPDISACNTINGNLHDTMGRL